MYDAVLNCSRLYDAAQRLGYRIRLMNHPNMRAIDNNMTTDSRLIKLSFNESYRTIFAESDLIVTDYSSIAFDFAYLRKPVLYYQADEKEFFSGAHTSHKGYFDYERDGFGAIEKSAESLVDRLIEYMENGCKLKPQYRARIEATFPYSDKNNCRRVYEAIVKQDNR